jgi:hypothetical protein
MSSLQKTKNVAQVCWVWVVCVGCGRNFHRSELDAPDHDPRQCWECNKLPKETVQ